jgi:hypothetical protein
MLAVGIVAGVACVVGALAQGGAARGFFFRGYLFAWMFWLGLSLGGMCIMMLHNLTGGEWGAGLRVVGAAAGKLLPVMVVLFVPILFGLASLYPWDRPAEVAASPVLAHRQAYLNPTFFMVRAAICMAIWCGLIFVLDAWQRGFARRPDARLLSRIRGLSAIGLILYLWTMTHAGIDWVMSRDTEFYSTTFGFILTVGQTLSAMALGIIVLGRLRVRGELNALAAAAHRSEEAPASSGQKEGGVAAILNDVGNVLLTLVILWAYVSFMEFLVIWMGNTREDNTWFVERGLGQPDPWRWVGLLLVLGHFFVPFYLLLFRRTKQYVPALTAVAWVLLVSHLVEQYWLVAPAGHGAGPRFDPHWLDGAALLAVGGIWMAGFFWMLPRQWAAAAVVAGEGPQTGEPARA